MSPGSRDGEAAVRAALQGRDSEVGAQGAPDEVELMHVLHDALPEDAIVIADMTVAAYWAALYLDAKRPGSFVYPASGALGCGVPLALGTAAAHPDRPTVAIVGDGGFLMGGHELLTARAEGLRVRHARRERLGVRDPAQLPGDDVRPHGRRRAERAGLRRPRRGVRRAAMWRRTVWAVSGRRWRGAGRSDRAGARRAPGGAQGTRAVGCNRRRGTQGSREPPRFKAGVASSALTAKSAVLRRRCDGSALLNVGCAWDPVTQFHRLSWVHSRAAPPGADKVAP